MMLMCSEILWVRNLERAPWEQLFPVMWHSRRFHMACASQVTVTGSHEGAPPPEWLETVGSETGKECGFLILSLGRHGYHSYHTWTRHQKQSCLGSRARDVDPILNGEEFQRIWGHALKLPLFKAICHEFYFYFKCPWILRGWV